MSAPKLTTVSRFRLELMEDASLKLRLPLLGTLAERLAHFLHQALGRQPREVAGAVFLTAQEEVSGYCLTHMGGRNRVFVSPADLFTAALLHGARKLALFHNHPSGSTRPSEADLRFGQRMVAAGQVLDLPVIENLVLGRPPLFSSIAGLVEQDDRRRRVQPKYRHPATGETWSGRGRLPLWLRRELLLGSRPEDFLLAEEEVSAAVRRQIRDLRQAAD